MSLYYEAAAILANSDNTGGSLKSRIYKKKDLKSTPGQIFALIAESSKWSLVLKDVIEKCSVLVEERKVRVYNILSASLHNTYSLVAYSHPGPAPHTRSSRREKWCRCTCQPCSQAGNNTTQSPIGR